MNGHAPWSGRLLAALVVAGLGACAAAPRVVPPELPAPATYLAEPLDVRIPVPDGSGGRHPVPDASDTGRVALQELVAGMEVPARWWTGFGTPGLDALIERALRANPDLQAAQAALRAAHEALLSQDGSRLPGVSLAYQFDRQRNPTGTLAPALNSGEAVFALHTAQVNVSYVPDAFGAIAGQRAVLQAQVAQQAALHEASALTLVANIVLAAIQQSALAAQIETTEEIIRLQREQLSAQARQQSVGTLAEADLLAAQAALAQVEATLPALQRQYQQQRNLLAVLSGQIPAAAELPALRLTDFRLPAALPLSVPAELVRHRPDVRAAEAAFQAAAAGAGIAAANRLPQLQLDASLGGTSTRLRDLLAPGNGFWRLGLGVAQTVFDGGSLAHREQVALAQAEQAAALLRGVALIAFQNVADSLQALEQDARADAASQRAEQAAEASLQAARRAMELGSSGALPVLAAEQARRQAALGAIQARASRLADSVALYQALGGGWWSGGAPLLRAP